MMNYNSETVKTIICEEYAKFVVEKYITEYGIERFHQVKPIFADVAIKMLSEHFNKNTSMDEWFTVHPNGKEHKGQPVCAEGNESKFFK